MTLVCVLDIKFRLYGSFYLILVLVIVTITVWVYKNNCCGAEATPVDNNRQRVQLASRCQLFRQLHPLFVLQFQIPSHFSPSSRPQRQFRFSGNIDGGVKTATRCHDDCTRRCPEPGTRIIAVDTVRTADTAATAAATTTTKTHDLPDRI